MSFAPGQDRSTCAEADLLESYSSHALQLDQHAAVEAHLRVCVACRRDYAALRGTDDSLWNRVAKKIGEEGWVAFEREVPVPAAWMNLDWDQPVPGIYCKILSTGPGNDRICLLVRLDPGVDYPPHTHAGVEELHLLDGELWIDSRKLHPGDYSRAEPGTTDRRVWSETGCTCMLITSRGDVLG